MSHQDFRIIDVGNRDVARQNAKSRIQTELVKRHSKPGVRDVDPESNPLRLVTGALRTKIIQARTLYNGGSKIGLTREELAKKISHPVQHIKQLEAGKMTLREAKQLAIHIERALKVKIL